jgi:hypothetical protein
MQDIIEINGEKYVKRGSEYNHQADKIIGLLGSDMYTVLSKYRAIIAGGAVLSTFTQQEVNDVDVYFRSKEDLRDAFVELTENWESVYIAHTDKSITLSDRDTNAIVQFIYFEYFDSAEAVFDAFDFTVCMAAVELGEKSQLVFHPRFFSDVASRTLHFHSNTRFPYASLARTKKYQEKGYKIGKGNLMAIGAACARNPIKSWDEARYQLGGVYGVEIDLKIQEGTEFSQEALHEVITCIKDDDRGIINSDYNECYKMLVGHYQGESPEEKDDTFDV